MKIEFDPAKDTANQVKHGVSLAAAAELEWETLLAGREVRVDYGETRMIGYVLGGLRLFCVVYVERGDVRRIISLRKANNREVERHASNY